MALDLPYDERSVTKAQGAESAAWLVARAYRFPLAAGGAATMLLAAIVLGGTPVLGGLYHDLYAAWYLLLGVPSFASLPLFPVFGELERAWPRLTFSRGLCAGFSVAIGLMSAGTAIASGIPRVPSLWTIWLSGVTMLLATLAGRKAVIGSLLIGMTAIAVEHFLPVQLITAFIQNTGPFPPILLCLVAVAAHVAFPPATH